MVYYKGSIILYGGMTDKGFTDDNFYRYQIDVRQWKVIQMSGVKPGSRAFHSMNFFKPDTLIIFGGKVKSGEEGGDFTVSSDLVCIDLIEMDASTPFIANIGPSPRFGHSASCNSTYQPECNHIILGGLDQTYCSLDVYIIREIELTSDKKWVYEQKKMHSNANVNYENKDDIYETAKKTILNYKKQIEVLNFQNIEINRKYAEYFNTLNLYKKNLNEEDLSSNEKKTEQKIRKKKIEEDKNKLTSQAKELKEYNELLNTQLKINREKFLILSEYLDDCITDIKFMDDILCSVDSSPHKLFYFANIDLDALSYKRKNYKAELDIFKSYFTECSFYEKEVYDKIVSLQNEQNEKFKNDYYIGTDEKQVLSFRDNNNELNNDN
jgi:hypothetical protein